MNLAEIIFGSFLVVALLGLAGYFAWRQKKTLEKLRKQDLPPEDRLYVHKQVQRRFLCCVLMAVLGVMLAGSFFLENHLRSEAAELQKAGEPGDEADGRNTVRFFTFYWIAFLLLLLVVLFLAAADLLATARFGHRQRRQLEAEHRAVMERQAQQFRRERNGHQ